MSRAPVRILIIRHGEKPGDPAKDSPDDGPDLSPRGFERAAALAVYVPHKFGRPDFLFATHESKHSNRPVETITPLAQALGIKPNPKHYNKDFQKVADDILRNAIYAGKLVLICWHHSNIPKLTKALGGSAPQDPWPDSVFDRIRSLELTDTISRSKIQVQDIPQMLLFGDSST